MRENFKRTNGLWHIEVGERTFYMRSFPVDMFHSMRSKKHDRFIAFISPEAKPITENEDLPEDNEIILDIAQLRAYLNKISNEIREAIK